MTIHPSLVEELNQRYMELLELANQSIPNDEAYEVVRRQLDLFHRYIIARMDAMYGQLNAVVKERVDLEHALEWHDKSNPLVVDLWNEAFDEGRLEGEDKAWDDLHPIAQEEIKTALGNALQWDEYTYREMGALDELAAALLDDSKLANLSKGGQEILQELIQKIDGSYWKGQSDE